MRPVAWETMRRIAESEFIRRMNEPEYLRKLRRQAENIERAKADRFDSYVNQAEAERLRRKIREAGHVPCA